MLKKFKMELIAKFIQEENEAEFIRFENGELMITIEDSSGSRYITLTIDDVQNLRHYLNLTDNERLD
jgi:hypothetical protein